MLTSKQNPVAALRHPPPGRRREPQQEGARFLSLIAATLQKDFYSAVCLVRRYFPRHVDRLSGELLFRFGVAFYQEADLDKARHCLELAATRNGSWQPKAMLLVGCIHAADGHHERAISVFQSLLDQNPQKCFRRQAMERLVKLQQGDPGRIGDGAGVPPGGRLARVLVGNTAQAAPAREDRQATHEARRNAPLV
jgi:tetratricopeptide (TPR) repeat protein